VEALAGGQGVLLGEIVDLDVAKLPLDAPPADDGDDSAAHAQTNGAVDELQALEDEAAEQAALDPPEDIKALRLRVVRAAMLGYKHKDEVHYTTGPRRWDGITNRCRSHLGRYPKWADCSSYVTWCLWDALGGPNAGPDIVNGQSWRGGYTGTLRDHGRRVTLEIAMPGDLVHYGLGTGSHVAIVVGKDRAISHGSEDGPFLVKPDYRDDLAEVRRYFA